MFDLKLPLLLLEGYSCFQKYSIKNSETEASKMVQQVKNLVQV